MHERLQGRAINIGPRQDSNLKIDNAHTCTVGVQFIIHDEIVLDIHAEDRYKIPELKEVFQNTKLGRFRANVKAGKNYGVMKEIEL